jgi:hypothetical protein
MEIASEWEKSKSKAGERRREGFKTWRKKKKKKNTPMTRKTRNMTLGALQPFTDT